jgi:hypothetical protein
MSMWEYHQTGFPVACLGTKVVPNHSTTKETNSTYMSTLIREFEHLALNEKSLELDVLNTAPESVGIHPQEENAIPKHVTNARRGRDLRNQRKSLLDRITY